MGTYTILWCDRCGGATEVLFEVIFNDERPNKRFWLHCCESCFVKIKQFAHPMGE